MHIQLFALCGLLIALSSGVMAVVMFSLGQARLHFLWGIFCLSVFVWGISGFVIGSTTNPQMAELWWRFAHVGVAFIPALFVHFVYTFLRLKRTSAIIIVYVAATCFALLALFSDLLIAHMRLVFNEFYYDSPPGVLYPLFTTYFFGLTIFSHWILYRSYRKTSVVDDMTRLDQTRAKYFFLGMLISFAGGSMSFLPVYYIDVYPITNFAVIMYPIIIGYAILRHRLFDVRVAAAQGLTFLLWLFVGIRFALSSSPEEAILNGILFGAVVVLGIFLVLSINKEIKTREKVERLSEEKSEFMSFASHEIRNPITAMRGYASLLLDGTSGAVPPEAKAVARKILTEGNDVLSLISQYLNKSKLELGQLSYAHERYDLGATVASLVDGYAPHAEERGLTLKKHIDLSQALTVVGDEGKTKEVVGNLIDNAIKYTRHGGVAVSVERIGTAVRAEISDTGAGIPADVMPNLFKKFSRADAKKMNLLGTGLGLYLGKVFIEAQGGKIWAESAGEGKGSRFIIEFLAA